MKLAVRPKRSHRTWACRYQRGIQGADLRGRVRGNRGERRRFSHLDPDEMVRGLTRSARDPTCERPVRSDTHAAVLLRLCVRHDGHGDQRPRAAMVIEKGREGSTSVSVSPLTMRNVAGTSASSGSARFGPPADPSTGTSHE